MYRRPAPYHIPKGYIPKPKLDQMGNTRKLSNKTTEKYFIESVLRIGPPSTTSMFEAMRKVAFRFKTDLHQAFEVDNTAQLPFFHAIAPVIIKYNAAMAAEYDDMPLHKCDDMWVSKYVLEGAYKSKKK